MSDRAANLPPLPEPTADGAGGLLNDVRSLWQQLLGLAHDRVRLAVLETRLAGLSLAAMVAAAVMVGLLVITAWMGLLAALLIATVNSGVSPIAALLFGMSANLAGAWLLCAFIRRRSRHLLWAASLRSLRPDAALQSAGGETP